MASRYIASQNDRSAPVSLKQFWNKQSESLKIEANFDEKLISEHISGKSYFWSFPETLNFFFTGEFTGKSMFMQFRETT